MSPGEILDILPGVNLTQRGKTSGSQSLSPQSPGPQTKFLRDGTPPLESNPRTLLSLEFEGPWEDHNGKDSFEDLEPSWMNWTQV